jgi:hypothetical protein
MANTLPANADQTSKLENSYNKAVFVMIFLIQKTLV